MIPCLAGRKSINAAKKEAKKRKHRKKKEGKKQPKSASQMMFNLVFVLLALGESSFEAMIIVNI